MIDILSWDWNLRVALKPAAKGQSARLQGLEYRRDFTIDGRVRAPQELRGKRVRVILSPFGPKVRFGRGGMKQVGRVALLSPSEDFDFEASLMLPEEAIATTATSLASLWRHLDIWTFGEGALLKVDAYSFAADIHPNLREWAGD